MKTIFFTLILFAIFSIKSYAQDSLFTMTPSVMKVVNKELKVKRTYKEKIDYLKYIIENIGEEDALLGEGFTDVEENSIWYQSAQNLLALAKIKKDTTNIVFGLNELKQCYSWNNYYDKAKNTCNEVLEILKNKEKTAYENEILGSTYTYLAEFYHNSWDYSNALENCLLGNEILTNPNNHIENNAAIASNYLVLCNIYFNIEREQEVFESINNVIKIYEQDKTLTYYGFTGNIFMGSYYLNFQDDVDKALYYYDQAKKIGKEEIKREENVVEAESFKAFAYYYDWQYDKAIALYNSGLDFFKKTENTVGVIQEYHYIAEAYKNNNTNTALKYLDSALVLFDSKTISLLTKKISILLSKANIYIENKDYDKALVILKENLLVARSEDMPEKEKEIYESLYGIYNVLNDNKNCTFYYNEYAKIDAKLQAESEKSEIKILEANYKYREIKSKLENEKVTLEISLLKQKKIKLYIYFALSLIFISTFFIFIVKDRQKKKATAEKLALEVKQELLKAKKEALNREVEFKDKSITNFALQINENNELLEKIKAPLKQLKRVVSGNIKHERILTEITGLINGYIDKNIEKVGLYVTVNKNIDNFELKIYEGYSNLTEKEKEIIKKIRLGKTSKEMANDLNIGVASVDNYRYIIRKKMKIPKGKSLEHFIKDI